MTTFCDCETCRNLKMQMKKKRHPLCPYCNEHHDHRVHCLEEVENMTQKIKDLEKVTPGDISWMRTKQRNMARSSLNKKEYFMPSLKDTIKKRSNYFVDVNDGKYSVYQAHTGGMKALRHGEPWRDLTGDGLAYWMMVELIEAKEKIEKALNELDNECIRPEGLQKAIRNLKGE